MKSTSASATEGAARPAFTLMEVLIAMSLGLVVVGAALNAYLGANSAVTRTVGDGRLKHAGEQALDDIYRELKGVRRVFSRGTTASSWLARTALRPWQADGLTPQVETADLVLPDMLASASFDASNAGLAAAAGNALVFVASEPSARITEPAASPPAGPHTSVFGTPTQHFSAYRFHVYHLAKKPLEPAERLVRGTDRATDGYTYRLMHWQSRPYLDYQEVRTWIERLQTHQPALSPEPTSFIQAKLAALSSGSPVKAPYAGAVDLSVLDAASGATPAGVYELTLSGGGLAASTARLASGDYRGAIAFGVQAGFGLPMVAFNNGTAAAPPPVPARDVSQGGDLVVPRFAPADDLRPFGFEVLYGGPQNGRQILLRLALALRDAQGRGPLKGLAVQQTVRLYER
ncbi:MAG: prepilin-type N-terminal cleavage/methylation domain-containing protein [Candidatus Sericytochromatia bacterium]|nr:prepilin-type N-terminal cleavage/methylation domain-containing protein [Candidatus Sericytochromatia bacterium]